VPNPPEHFICLNLGSNIQPEQNLPAALARLRQVARVEAVSGIWESESVGFAGPNFLNACVLVRTSFAPAEFKEQVIRPIEAQLGRVRSAEKNAPRTVDIDIVLFNGQPFNDDFWHFAFVLIPLAELFPQLLYPGTSQSLAQAAQALRAQVWIVPRPDVIFR
jgi:2-amino-4-hydroxy-6-hydroxymethyldihydropteridine diphosphokinase